MHILCMCICVFVCACICICVCMGVCICRCMCRVYICMYAYVKMCRMSLGLGPAGRGHPAPPRLPRSTLSPGRVPAGQGRRVPPRPPNRRCRSVGNRPVSFWAVRGCPDAQIEDVVWSGSGWLLSRPGPHRLPKYHVYEISCCLWMWSDWLGPPGAAQTPDVEDVAWSESSWPGPPGAAQAPKS